MTHPALDVRNACDPHTPLLLAALDDTVRGEIESHFRHGPRDDGKYLTGSQLGDDSLEWVSIHHQRHDEVSSCMVFRGGLVVQGYEVSLKADLPDTVMQSIGGQPLSNLVRHRLLAEVTITDMSVDGGFPGMDLMRFSTTDGGRPD